MKQIVPYISVTNALACLKFYEEVFNAKIIDGPLMLDDIEEFKNFKGKVGHVALKIGDSTLFLNDVINDKTYTENQIHFVIETSSIEELKMAFQKLSLNGTILHEMKELFWCQLSGYVKDQYGVSWSLYYGPK